MNNQLIVIGRQLSVLSDQIQAGRFAKAGREWGGADVVLSRSSPETHSAESFYPQPRYVISLFALELSWMFERLRDLFSPVLDGASKIEFYGRLANAANRYLTRVDAASQTVQGLLLAVAHEAFAIRDEMEEGKFQYLLISTGNTIFDDFVDEAERSGYLGHESTRKFLEEMERGHHSA